MLGRSNMSAAAGRTAVYELKKALRKAAKAKLSALTPEMKSVGSAAVTASLCARPEFAAASSVAVYLSMPDEVDTAAIISEIFKSGKRCFVPRLVDFTPLWCSIRHFDTE